MKTMIIPIVILVIGTYVFVWIHFRAFKTFSKNYLSLFQRFLLYNLMLFSWIVVLIGIGLYWGIVSELGLLGVSFAGSLFFSGISSLNEAFTVNKLKRLYIYLIGLHPAQQDEVVKTCKRICQAKRYLPGKVKELQQIEKSVLSRINDSPQMMNHIICYRLFQKQLSDEALRSPVLSLWRHTD